VFENQVLFHSSAPPPLNDSFNDLHSNLSRAATLVGTVSALGKRVGPVIERSLVRNPDRTVAIFGSPLPSTGSLVSV
jgi:hypothetical protein